MEDCKQLVHIIVDNFSLYIVDGKVRRAGSFNSAEEIRGYYSAGESSQTETEVPLYWKSSKKLFYKGDTDAVMQDEKSKGNVPKLELQLL